MRLALLLASSLFLAPAAQAAPLGTLMPRVQMASMFEVERNSAGGGGARADGKVGGPPAKAPPDPEEEQTTSSDASEAATAPEPHRGGPMDRPKSRWKSMMPGALQ